MDANAYNGGGGRTLHMVIIEVLKELIGQLNGGSCSH